MKIGVYAELDTLLDSRLGTLARIDPKAAMEIDFELYRGRMSDEFEYLNPVFKDQTFRELYARRDVYTLMEAGPTLFAFEIGKLISSIESDVLRNNPTVEELILDVNMWPYDLTQEEIQLVCQSIGARTGLVVPINPVFVPPAKMTTGYIKKTGWSILHIYNVAQWSKAVFNPLALPELVPTARLVIPKLAQSMAAAAEFKEQTKVKQIGNPFDVWRASLAPIIAVEYLPIRMFSFVDAVDVLAEGQKVEAETVKPA